jgi:hypothetical protein
MHIDARSDPQEGTNGLGSGDNENDGHGSLRGLFFSAESDEDAQREDLQKRFSENTISVTEKSKTGDNESGNLTFFRFC